MKDNGATGAVYGMGLIGSAVYFIQQSSTVGTVLFALLKAIVWPAILVYKAFEFLK